MYKSIKKNIKSIVPNKFLFKNELFFRYFYGIFFLGSTHQCNVCNKKIKHFIKLENGDLLCPFCGSLSRSRRLWHLLNSENSIKGNFLHFSPSRSLYRKLKKEKKINYFSTDFENEFLADYRFNITNIDQPNKKFDTIVCYHILEHIIDDQKAMKELFRVLKTNGIVYIQTPYKDGEIYEDYSIKSPEKREIHFGQHDHVRIYSIGGLKKRLESCGFKVSVKTFDKNDKDFYLGFKYPETILSVTKL